MALLVLAALALTVGSIWLLRRLGLDRPESAPSQLTDDPEWASALRDWRDKLERSTLRLELIRAVAARNQQLDVVERADERIRKNRLLLSNSIFHHAPPETSIPCAPPASTAPGSTSRRPLPS